MRTILLALLLLAQSCRAAECFAVADAPSPAQIVLSGVVEYKPVGSTGEFQVFLNLSAPICIESVADGGRRFKNENVKLLMVGLPPNLMGSLQPLERVRLRGELWSPTFNDKSERNNDVVFAVKEVL